MAPAQCVIGGVQVTEHGPVGGQHESPAAMETAADAAEQGFLMNTRSECRARTIAIKQQQLHIAHAQHAAQRGQVDRPEIAIVVVFHPTIDHDSVVPRLVCCTTPPPLPDRAHAVSKSIVRCRDGRCAARASIHENAKP
ncbi:hypothetical protein D3C72_1514730 [compost metagenome]